MARKVGSGSVNTNLTLLTPSRIDSKQEVPQDVIKIDEAGLVSRSRGVTLFDDQTSNVTWTYNTARGIGTNIDSGTWMGQYFEGNNYYVYIHGKDDPEGDWWRSESAYKRFHGSGGVLVNCHFDS